MFKGFIKKILGEQNEEMIRENERLKMQLEQANKQTVEKETNKDKYNPADYECVTPKQETFINTMEITFYKYYGDHRYVFKGKTKKQAAAWIGKHKKLFCEIQEKHIKDKGKASKGAYGIEL